MGRRGGAAKGFNFLPHKNAMNDDYIREVSLTDSFPNRLVHFSFGDS